MGKTTERMSPMIADNARLNPFTEIAGCLPLSILSDRILCALNPRTLGVAPVLMHEPILPKESALWRYGRRPLLDLPAGQDTFFQCGPTRRCVGVGVGRCVSRYRGKSDRSEGRGVGK